MSFQNEPLVSVLTPVYNGEDFLVECIESVLNQTYQNYEYIIVNNCSRDRTLEIAQGYAKKDRRIRIQNNTRFVDVIENHNIAFGLIAEAGKYCKVVSADDFISPSCIEKLVLCAESNPSVGIVGCYQLSGSIVRWQGFKYPVSVFPGREVCRRVLLGGQPDFGFGSPTSLLYRADLVRQSPFFYPNPSPHSDTSACFRDLQKCDFGFVYAILSFERMHGETQTSKSTDMNRYSSAYLNDLIEYGPAYIGKNDVDRLVKVQLNEYHRFLAINRLFQSRGKEFWDYHRTRLAELGHPLKGFWFFKAASRTVIQEILNPEQAIRKTWRRISRKTR